MNTITAQRITLTSTGPVALIDGVWYSVNGTSTEVYEVRYALRPSEVEALGLAPVAQIIDLTSTIAPTVGAYHFVCLDEGTDRISVDGVVHTPSEVLGSGSHLWVWHDGVRYHAADWSGDVDDVTPLVRDTATPPAPPALAPIRIGQRVFWPNMFGIINSGRVEFVDEMHVIVRLPDDEDTGTRGGTLTLRRSQVTTSRPSR